MSIKIPIQRRFFIQLSKQYIDAECRAMVADVRSELTAFREEAAQARERLTIQLLEPFELVVEEVQALKTMVSHLTRQLSSRNPQDPTTDRLGDSGPCPSLDQDRAGLAPVSSTVQTVPRNSRASHTLLYSSDDLSDSRVTRGHNPHRRHVDAKRERGVPDRSSEVPKIEPYSGKEPWRDFFG